MVVAVTLNHRFRSLSWILRANAVAASFAVAACGDDTSATDGPSDSSSTGDDPTNPSDPTADPSADTTVGESSSSGSGESSSSGPGEESSSSGGESSSGSESTGPAETCGNDAIDGDEVCDGDALADETCASQGFDGGTLACADDCSALDVSGCFNMDCGNGIAEGDEACDGDDLAAQNCQTQGFPGGVLVCNPDCGGFDTSGCLNMLCGNGTREGEEACDGQDLGVETCLSQGQPDGVLGCALDCTSFDYLGCGNPCLDENIGSAIGAAVAMGDTTGDDDDINGSCGLMGGNDHVMLFTAPADGNYVFDTFGSGYDTKMQLFSDCSTEIVCNDDSGGILQSQVFTNLDAGQAVLVVVDGYNGNAGSWVLNITQPVCGDGVVAVGEPCEPGDIAGQTCEAQGFPGGGVLDCAADCSFDTAGCSAQGSGDCCIVDDTAGCDNLACQDAVCAVDPSCCNGPWDGGCTFIALGAAECEGIGGACDQGIDCEDEDIVSAVGPAVASGNTAAEDNDFDGSCGSAGGNDRTIEFTPPATGTYVFDTFGSGYDTKLSLFAGCDPLSELVCDDDSGGTAQSEVTFDLTAGQGILVVVDGYNAATGDWVLNITPPA
jgi:hypothetical protein